MAKPTGLVAFLMTDIEGSSRLWEVQTTGMQNALEAHDHRLRRAISEFGGHIFATAGDAFGAAFHSAEEAVSAAITAQRDLAGLQANGEPVRVRMGIHIGEAEERDGNYFGRVLNRCGRLRDAAHGGQIIVSQAIAGRLASTADIDAIDLGEHRLRDLEHPERIFQVHASGLASAFPPLRALLSAQTNFPIQVSSFVGRHEELEEVAKLVRGSRLVTLTGVGGSGKTRLALQTSSANMAGEFDDGTWFVDLASINEPEVVVQQVAATFGVSETQRPQLDAVVDRLKSSKALLIMDNCEHLLTSVRRVVNSLLAGTKNLRVLTTSREPLRLRGEVVFRVPTLSFPGSDLRLGLNELTRFDALRLFAARAESALPGFRITADNAHSVAEVCRRLDGIPLAVELAAARVATFSPRQLVRHLDHRLRLLSGGAESVGRQDTLAATIDWSFDLLTALERQLLLRLSVFRADFSIEAAQSIVATGGIGELDLLELLPRLVEKSLVVAERSRDEMRYRLLETIWEYASATWQPDDERKTFEASHAAFYLGLADEGAAGLRSSKHEELTNRLETERANLRQALRWSFDSGHLETGMRLAGSLYRFWLYKDEYAEGTRWLEMFLSAGGQVEAVVRAKALLGYGILAADTDAVLGRDALRESVAIYQGIDADEAVTLDYATAVNALGIALSATGEFAESEACFLEALEVSRQLNMPWGISVANMNVGRSAAHAGRIEEARNLFDAAIDIARTVGSTRLEGDALSAKGQFEQDYGDLETSQVVLEQSIQIYEEAGYAMGTNWSCRCLAITLCRLGEVDRAVEVLSATLSRVAADPEQFRRVGVLIEFALATAEVDVSSGRFDRAGQLLSFVSGLLATGRFEDFRTSFRQAMDMCVQRGVPEAIRGDEARGQAPNDELVRRLILDA